MECDVDTGIVSIRMRVKFLGFPQLLFQRHDSTFEVPMDLDHDLKRSDNVSELHMNASCHHD